MNIQVSPDQSAWYASLELELRRSEEKTRLRRVAHKGPLYVQKPFYPEGDELAHVYLLHPPGGVVSGDHLQIDINVSDAAQALVTTPGAARIYRARQHNPLQQQSVSLRVAAAASLEWFPLETIVFDGACVELDTRIDIEGDGTFIGWELTCFGLPASDEPFTHGSFRQRYRVFRDGMPEFIEGLVIDEHTLQAQLQGSAALRGEAVCGLFLAGPFAEPLDAELLEDLRSMSDVEGADLSQSGRFVVGRYLGESTDQGRRAFATWWHQLRRQLLDRPACPPRIWLT